MPKGSSEVLYIVTEGTLELTNEAGSSQVIEATSENNIVGSDDLMSPHASKGYSATASSHVKAFKLQGPNILDTCLFEMNLRYALDRLESSRWG